MANGRPEENELLTPVFCEKTEAVLKRGQLCKVCIECILDENIEGDHIEVPLANLLNVTEKLKKLKEAVWAVPYAAEAA